MALIVIFDFSLSRSYSQGATHPNIKLFCSCFEYRFSYFEFLIVIAGVVCARRTWKTLNKNI